MASCWKLTDDWCLGNCNLAFSHTRTRFSASSPPKCLSPPCTGWAAIQGWVSVLLGKKELGWSKSDRSNYLLWRVAFSCSPFLWVGWSNKFYKVLCIISISHFSKQPVQLQAHLHTDHSHAGQCHAQPRLEMLFHWHQVLNLVQRWLYNLRSHPSSPLNMASVVHWTACPMSAIAQQKTNREGMIQISWVTYDLVLRVSVRLTINPTFPAASV